MSAPVHLLASLAIVAAENQDEFDPNDVTPGVAGFALTFIVMVVVLLLIFDMVRRIRRVNYRAEVRQQLEAEQRDDEAAAADGEAVDGGADRPRRDENP
jgi:uncharacterized membrane protein YcjF (UPF0283 family)